ncbi:DUF4386 domain-containing protein [Demequina salsinemoris]|uniref:DUF4386 domain-containing protein n=1 Tax=Demequina salsinemoris TaxID=577470 RepID=UPI000785B11F|nr:DUF4386 domain-containing protein [Demequina salsinemoris]
MDDATRTTARVTGASYLGLAVTGMLGFLLLRPAFLGEDGLSTAANLVDSPPRTLLFLGLELGTVATQALAAVCFYKLLRGLNPVAAWATAAFGMANALAILGSAAMLMTAAAVEDDASLAPGGDVGATVSLLWATADSWWAVGALFFGLWLIPMGHVARTSGRFPSLLGWLLIVGGAGYVVSAFLGLVEGAAPSWLVDAVAMPATVAELWMIGYLLIVGIRPATAPATASPAAAGPLPSEGVAR